MSKHDGPHAGRTGGKKPSIRDIIFRRSSSDNAGLASDVQHAITARFQRENRKK